MTDAAAPQSYPQGSGYGGPAAGWFNDSNGSPFNGVAFAVDKELASRAFSLPVKVISVSKGGADGIAMVAVQPMVSQTDGFGNLTPHGTIYNIPAFRYQAGGAAIICDPVAGEIGHIIVCQRDISNVVKNQDVAGPGSYRQNDWQDGIYYGSISNKAITTRITISPGGGVDITTNKAITIESPNMTLDSSGNLRVTGDVVANMNGEIVSLTNHLTSEVTFGTEESGPPVPGT